MKKFYVKPEMEIHALELETEISKKSFGEQGDQEFSNERNSVFDDEPAASGDEGGYKRTLW